MTLRDDSERVLHILPELRRPLRPKDRAGGPAQALSGAQVKVLFQLGLDGPQTMGELAGRLGISCPAATDLIDKLEHLGQVERARDDRDRRVVWARLTPQAAQFVQEIMDMRRRQVESMLSNLSETDRAQFVACLQGLAAALNRDPEPALGSRV